MRSYTMGCGRHGRVETFEPMPGSAPICPKCSEEELELERMRRDHPRNVLERLDRIEALLQRIAPTGPNVGPAETKS